jgi:hypothetical protein
MNLIEIQRRLGLLLDQFGSGLPEEQLADMKELVAAGEPGVAFENYCVQLYEYDISVPADVLKELEVLGRAMGMNEEHWVRLRQ